MTTPLDGLLAEHAELEGRLADPSVHADPALARSLGRRYAELIPVVETARELGPGRCGPCDRPGVRRRGCLVSRRGRGA